MQYQRLAQEMQDAAVAGLIQKRPRIKASRSLPAIVMKPAPKPRVRKERTEIINTLITIILYGSANTSFVWDVVHASSLLTEVSYP